MDLTAAINLVAEDLTEQDPERFDGKADAIRTTRTEIDEAEVMEFEFETHQEELERAYLAVVRATDAEIEAALQV
jgi:hypothetical protein